MSEAENCKSISECAQRLLVLAHELLESNHPILISCAALQVAALMARSSDLTRAAFLELAASPYDALGEKN